VQYIFSIVLFSFLALPNEGIMDRKRVATTISKSTQIAGVIYSSNSPRPDNATEFLQLIYNEDISAIKSIHYWTDMDPKPMQLTIHKQDFFDGEIGGAILELSWPENPEVITLGLLEDRANLTFADGSFQEYIMVDQ
jgi:hypothetical protein